MATAPSSPSAATARPSNGWISCPGRPIDPRSVDLSCEMLGTKMKYPIMVAPTAAQVPLHPDGEIGMHRGATAASNTPMIVSHNTSTAVGQSRRGGEGAAVVAVLSAAGPRCRPEDSRGVAERRLHGGRGHGRSAGVVLRTHRTGSKPGRQAARRAGRGAAVRAGQPRDRRRIACRRDGSGTRGGTSTRFARSSRCRCS